MLAARMKMFAGEEASGPSQKDIELAEKNFARRVKAVQWVDKEIRKLIAVIEKTNGSTTFGQLFKVTVDDFEAISGTLVAAKKRNVVEYDGQLLMQGMHDGVVIKLLCHEIADSPLPDKEEFMKHAFKPAQGGFNQKPVDNKCATCGKIVYVNERLGAMNKVYHRQCFACVTCKRPLDLGAFCCVNGVIYCDAHYSQMFAAGGGKYADDPRSPPKPAARPAPKPLGGAKPAEEPASSEGVTTTSAASVTAAAEKAAAEKKAAADKAAAEKKAADDKKAADAAASAKLAAEKKAADEKAAADAKKAAAEAKKAAEEEARVEAERVRLLAEAEAAAAAAAKLAAEQERAAAAAKAEEEARAAAEAKRAREAEEQRAKAEAERLKLQKEEEELKALKAAQEEKERAVAAAAAAKAAEEKKAEEKRKQDEAAKAAAAAAAKAKAEAEAAKAAEEARKKREEQDRIAAEEKAAAERAAAEKKALAEKAAAEAAAAEAAAAAAAAAESAAAKAAAEAAAIEAKLAAAEQARAEAEAEAKAQAARAEELRKKREAEEAAAAEVERERERVAAEKKAAEEARAAEKAEEERKAAAAAAAAAAAQKAAEEKRALEERAARLAAERKETEARLAREEEARKAEEARAKEKAEEEKRKQVELQAKQKEELDAASALAARFRTAAALLPPKAADKPQPQQQPQQQPKPSLVQSRASQLVKPAAPLPSAPAPAPSTTSTATAAAGTGAGPVLPRRMPPPVTPTVSVPTTPAGPLSPTAGPPPPAPKSPVSTTAAPTLPPRRTSSPPPPPPDVEAEAAAAVAAVPPPEEEEEEEEASPELINAIAHMPPEMYSLSIDLSFMGRSFRLLGAAVRYIMRHGTFETDIFRTSLNRTETDLVVKVLESNAEPAAVQFERYQINSIAAALKRVLRKREPLISQRLYAPMLAIQRKQATGTGQGKYLEIAAAISELPENNKKLLCMLFDMIVQVAHNASQTKMTADQLGYTFAPSIMAVPAGNNVIRVQKEQHDVNQLLVDMINNHDTIWDNVILESKLTHARKPSNVFLPTAQVTRPSDVKKAQSADVPECSRCSKPFSIIRWRTTCVGCGQIFCSGCCKHKAPESVVGKVTVAQTFVGKGLLCSPCNMNLNIKGTASPLKR